jgi:uncharacterized oxidoreductase
MDLTSNIILITGGASGIGLALAERFQQAGSTVVICGRREDKLREVKEGYPDMITRVCDVAKENERISLYEWAVNEFPQLNVLINNAGIQRRIRLIEHTDWAQTRQEIDINLNAPVHLSMLFVPHLLSQPRAAIINVTSGLAFSPLAGVPVYCATKAALRSFTLSLRHQLAGTSIDVIEIIPPAVDTDLGGVGLHTFGVPLNEFANSAMERLQKGDLEIPYGSSEEVSRASREELDSVFEKMNPPQST